MKRTYKIENLQLAYLFNQLQIATKSSVDKFSVSDEEYIEDVKQHVEATEQALQVLKSHLDAIAKNNKYEFILSVFYKIEESDWNTQYSHVIYEDAEYDLHVGLDEDSVEIFEDTIRITFAQEIIAQSESEAIEIALNQVNEKYQSQNTWTVLDVEQEEILYIGIKYVDQRIELLEAI